MDRKEEQFKKILEIMGKDDLSEEIAITKREAFLCLALDFIIETASTTKDYNEVMTTIGVALGGVAVELSSALAAVQINENKNVWLDEFRELLHASVEDMRKGKEKFDKEREVEKKRKEKMN